MVKHLNPRQGITTTDAEACLHSLASLHGETPKSPPGDYNYTIDKALYEVVYFIIGETPKSPPGDYNRLRALGELRWSLKCETPKSPPGDYNSVSMCASIAVVRQSSVKHLNPRQGITTHLTQRCIARLWIEV